MSAMDGIQTTKHPTYRVPVPVNVSVGHRSTQEETDCSLDDHHKLDKVPFELESEQDWEYDNRSDVEKCSMARDADDGEMEDVGNVENDGTDDDESNGDEEIDSDEESESWKGTPWHWWTKNFWMRWTNSAIQGWIRSRKMRWSRKTVTLGRTRWVWRTVRMSTGKGRTALPTPTCSV